MSKNTAPSRVFAWIFAVVCVVALLLPVACYHNITEFAAHKQLSAASEIETRAFPVWEQFVPSAGLYVVKPIYTLFMLGMMLWLRRSSAPDLKALRRGINVLFFAEAVFAGNYFITGQAPLFEYVHMVGMIVGFALTVWAIIETIDIRILHITDNDRRCGALELCGSCIKLTAAPCGFRRVFLLLIPAAMIVSAIPLFAALKYIYYTAAFGAVSFDCGHGIIYQFFEMRFCPYYALTFFAASFFMLLLGGWGAISKAKVLFSAGAGAMGFGLLRFFFFKAFSDDLVWMGFFEEFTEMVFMVSVACILWVFRARLFAGKPRLSDQSLTEEQP